MPHAEPSRPDGTNVNDARNATSSASTANATNAAKETSVPNAANATNSTETTTTPHRRRGLSAAQALRAARNTALVIAVGGALLVGYAVATSVWAQAAEPVPGEKTSTPVQGTALTHHAVSDHAAADAQALLQRLQSLYPATRFGSVQPTPWAGVFEVQMGATLAYADATGRHFLFGHLYDMQSQTDLTAQRKDVLNRVDVATLPLADAMTEVRGSGKRQLIIFSDPDCPFCRRLEADLQGLTDVTIHTFLMPLASLHPQARAKAVAVWCAPDRLAAWKALMLRGVDPGRDAELNPELNPGANPGANLVAHSGTKPDPSSQPPAAACDHPVDRNVALADKLGIHGTPTLVAGDGRLIQGAQSLDQVSAWLDRGATAASAPSSTKP